jgi:hypothetical protein
MIVFFIGPPGPIITEAGPQGQAAGGRSVASPGPHAPVRDRETAGGFFHFPWALCSNGIEQYRYQLIFKTNTFFILSLRAT